MKIKSRDNIKGNIISVVEVGNKNYIRIQKNKFNGLDEAPITEWKNKKTNHIVNAEKSKKLEEMFNLADETTKPVIRYDKSEKGPAVLPISGTTSIYDFSIIDAEKIDRKIKEYIKYGSLLSAVKYYKDISGVGLKEAKDYVDSVNVIYKAEQRWEKGMAPTREVQTIDWINKFFVDARIDKEDYIRQTKAFYIKSYNNSLETVKKIKDVMGWGLYESKMFFDTFIK
jgi:ribosomal protein L7/L12